MPIKKNLRIELGSGDDNFRQSPRKIEIRDSKFGLLDSSWLTFQNYYNTSLDPGLYIVTLSFASGEKDEKVVEVLPERSVTISFKKPEDTAEVYYNKSIYSSHLALREFGIALWCMIEDKWAPVPLPEYLNVERRRDTIRFNLSLSEERHILQFRGHGPRKPKCVCLPLYSELTCQIDRSNYSDQVGFPFEIKIETRNAISDSILQLMSRGSVDDAKSLVPAERAEDLLWDKQYDPSAAAVGGYYLLKIQDLDRMHDWGKNLANRFPKIPDGSIIYAWQLLQQQRRSNELNVSEIRRRLLEAFNRGIPIYTEGMRLLYEGINLLYFHNEKQRGGDTELFHALTELRKYTDSLDWSGLTTSFFAESPDTPL
jgi:hypothetical protein